ncbi:MAG: hypothetical protein QM790_20410 [Nibricoccus sp.]
MAEANQEPIAISLRLSKALGLARQNRLREAQQLLAAEGTLPENALELHALAALATGDGDYSRALRLWRLLLQREPGHAEAKRMIDTIELWFSRPAWFSYLPIGLGISLATVFFLVIAWVLSGDAPPPSRAAAPAPKVQSVQQYQPAAPPPTVNFSTPPRQTDTRRNRSR